MHAVDVLSYGHRNLMRSLSGIEGADWKKTGVCGVWSAKDVMAHLASYEIMLGEVLGNFQGLEQMPTWQRYQVDGGNHAEVEQRKTHTIEEILAEYAAANEIVDQRIRQLSSETLRQSGALPWYGEDYDLEDYVVYVGYGHKREHAAQMNAFKDRLQS